MSQPRPSSPALRRHMLTAAVVVAILSALLTIAGLLARPAVAPLPGADEVRSTPR